MVKIIRMLLIIAAVSLVGSCYGQNRYVFTKEINDIVADYANKYRTRHPRFKLVLIVSKSITCDSYKLSVVPYNSTADSDMIMERLSRSLNYAKIDTMRAVVATEFDEDFAAYRQTDDDLSPIRAAMLGHFYYIYFDKNFKVLKHGY